MLARGFQASWLTVLLLVTINTGVAGILSIEDMRPFWHPFISAQSLGLCIAFAVNAAGLNSLLTIFPGAGATPAQIAAIIGTRPLQIALPADLDFQVVDLTIQFNGICSTCQDPTKGVSR